MQKNWRDKYSELTDFLAVHPEIVITPKVSRIPADVRPRFFELFDSIRATFLEEKEPELIKQAEALSLEYIKAEAAITELLKLEDIKMMPGLKRFLHDPVNQLVRVMYDPLFETFNGKKDVAQFEAVSVGDIRTSFDLLYQLGYEKWVMVRLLSMLEADKVQYCPLPRLGLLEAQKTVGMLKAEIPPLEKTNKLTFEFEFRLCCNVADFIIHSGKTGKYISSRSQFSESLFAFKEISLNREWLDIKSVPPLDSNLTLMYQGNDPYDISQISDTAQICRPDVVILCRASKDALNETDQTMIKNYHDSLKPIAGTFVISLNTVAEALPVPLGEGITIMNVGLDPTRLAPIVEALAGQQTAEKITENQDM